MSTNYYLRHLPSEEQINKLKTLIDESCNGNNFDEILEMSNSLYREPDEFNSNLEDFGILHIGKRSNGWQFLWCPNIIKINESYIDNEGNYVQKYSYKYRYPLTRQGLMDFVYRDDIVVVDEYNEIWDKNAFFEMTFNWCIDGMTYIDYDSREWPMVDYQEKFKKLGYEFSNQYQNDFKNDGLRWSIYDDFI